MQALLEQIADRGAPAYAVRARELLDRAANESKSPQLHEAIEALIDAYLHDPYLVRNRTA